jgi:serine O-acetyltransferase
METSIANKRHLKAYNVALKEEVQYFTKQLFYFLFKDEESKNKIIDKLELNFSRIAKELKVKGHKHLWNRFADTFIKVRQLLDLDASAIEECDPAAKSLAEVYLAYPGFFASAIYRLSHELYLLRVPILPRMMSEYAHSVTGIDIHPGASIGKSFFIDHGTGIVIGETTVIKNNVKIYQGVTLGGIQVKKQLAATKRHPTIEDNVVIYANATILGGDIVVGANAVIGANVWITKSIPENAIVTHQSNIKISLKND